MEVVYLDFIKAFDTLLCDSLMEKLRKHRLSKLTVKWAESCLNFQLQTVALSNMKCNRGPAISGGPQQLVLD